MTTRTRLSVLLISTPLLAFIVVGGLLGKTPSEDSFRHLRVFDDVVSLVVNNYVEEVNVNKVMDGAMRGLADGLDADSAYLTADEVSSLESHEKPAAGDVGIELTRQYYLRVIAVRDDSPAAKAGLQTGDYVRAIDSKPTRDLSVFEGMRLLRGAPGTKTTLTIIRGNAAEPRQIDVLREKTPGSIVSGRMLKPDVGYLRIGSFGPDTPGKVRSQVNELVRGGAKQLVVDVRHTAEGPFDSGLETARLFVKGATLAEITGRDDSAAPQPTLQKTSASAKQDDTFHPRQLAVHLQTISSNPGDGEITVPVTLLSTTGTSGAAELFVSALVNNKRAELIGERTLGRVGLQKLVALPGGKGLWLTYARYTAPSGDAISGKGLIPTVEVDEPEVDFDTQKPAGDPILDAALAHLQKKGA